MKGNAMYCLSNINMLRRLIQFFLAILLLCIPVCTSYAEDFRIFLYHFFNDNEFQIERIKFPLTKESFDIIEFNAVPKEEKISRTQWEHLPGPDHYRCNIDCFDIVIYDNFERKWHGSEERVVAFIGVENGINNALYFKLENEKWMLVKWQDFDL